MDSENGPVDNPKGGSGLEPPDAESDMSNILMVIYIINTDHTEEIDLLTIMATFQYIGMCIFSRWKFYPTMP